VDDQSWPQFLRDQRKGIIVRDNTAIAEHLLAEAYMARNRAAAREYLRQSHIEFAELSARDRAQLFGFLDTLLIPNLFYNPAETEQRRDTAGARITPVEVPIKAGAFVVHRGEEVTPAMAAQLAALRNLLKPYSILAQFTGFFVFIAIPCTDCGATSPFTRTGIATCGTRWL
jgi:membrane-associated HD superfamily phosphohydrolase